MGVIKDVNDKIKAKKISLKYDVPMITANCFVSNGMCPTFVCSHCKDKDVCAKIRHEESKKK